MSIALSQINTLSRAGVPSSVIEALAREDIHAALSRVSHLDLEAAVSVSGSLYEAHQYEALIEARSSNE